MNSAKKYIKSQEVNKSPSLPEVNKKETLQLIERINNLIQKNPEIPQKAASVLENWLNPKKK